MALRAGYFGLKRKLINKLENMLDISTIGDGLSLVSGTLSAAIKSIGDGLTLSAEGVLSSDSTGGINYSTTEQDTGLKWIDERTIYQKTWSKDGIDNIPANGKLWITSDYSDIDLVITATAVGAALSESAASCEGGASVNAVVGSSGITLYSNPSIDAEHVTLTYVKTATNTRKKGGKK